jgi:hypothetical protein
MRKRIHFFVFLLSYLLIIFPPEPASAIWIEICGIHISPEHPTDQDSITVFISGAISTPCDSIWYEYHEIQGNRIDLHLQFYQYQGYCIQVIAPFYLQIPIGRLPAGLCTLYVIVDSYPNFWTMTFEVTEHPGDPTEVRDSAEDLVDEFVLSQNHPNPFNSSTIIAYEIERGKNVTLRIYDILGKEVRELVNSRQSPGKYQIIWDGRDNQGKEVSSGIYFYQLEAGNSTGTKKLVLIK